MALPLERDDYSICDNGRATWQACNASKGCPSLKIQMQYNFAMPGVTSEGAGSFEIGAPARGLEGNFLRPSSCSAKLRKGSGARGLF